MTKKILMLKDSPVLTVSGFNVDIIDFNRLPLSLKSPDVDFDRIFHGWTESRILNINRTNADRIIAGFKMSRNNSYDIAAKMHFVTLTDCYWMKDESENISWKDVNLYSADLSEEVADTSLFGKSQIFSGHITSPELSTLGLSAKAWYRDNDGTLWLYKIGKKELAASAILDAIGAYHVRYYDASDEVGKHTDDKHIEKIKSNNEKLVKSRIFTDERRSIATWYDYEEYCEHNDLDPYDILRNDHYFHEMQVVDYLLNNPDRHGENWGFFTDADSGKILGLHPLFDHDHAFSDDDVIVSQTDENELSLEKAALISVHHISGLDISALYHMDKPEDLSNDQWYGVIRRVGILMKELRRKDVCTRKKS